MTQLPAGGSGVVAPPLPGVEGMLVWTAGYWAMLWASPMAVLWREADVPALIRMARLQDQAMRDNSRITAAELSEIRQLEDRFGLSPLARRRLQWDIAAVDPVAGRQPARIRKLRAV